MSMDAPHCDRQSAMRALGPSTPCPAHGAMCDEFHRLEAEVERLRGQRDAAREECGRMALRNANAEAAGYEKGHAEGRQYERALASTVPSEEQPPKAESCDVPIWDGPYKMRCGYVLVGGKCVRHGEQPGGGG